MKKTIQLASLIMLFSLAAVVSCKKEKEETNSNINDPLQSAFVYYEQNEMEEKMAKLWKNFATYQGIDLNNGVQANLNETMSTDEAITLLHYGLNTAMVNPRIAYANELADSFSSTFSLNAAGQVTYSTLSATLASVANQLKEVRNGIGNENKALNRLTFSIEGEGANNTLIIKVYYLFTYGPVWSMDDITADANYTPTGINFNAPTPGFLNSRLRGQRTRIIKILE